VAYRHKELMDCIVTLPPLNAFAVTLEYLQESSRG